MNTDVLIVFVSALLAAVSFMAFALPFLQNTEKKERYRSVIEKKRKSLFEQAKEQQKNRGKQTDTMSARESVAAFYKVQELMGEMGEKVRDMMLQAGIRSEHQKSGRASVVCPPQFSQQCRGCFAGELPVVPEKME